MYIKSIEWRDKDAREAILTVSDGIQELVCFCHPCFYHINDTVSEPLKCLDVKDIIVSRANIYDIKSKTGTLNYKLMGELINAQAGLIKVYSFYLHIDEKKLPKDLIDGNHVQFTVSRIDVW